MTTETKIPTVQQNRDEMAAILAEAVKRGEQWAIREQARIAAKSGK